MAMSAQDAPRGMAEAMKQAEAGMALFKDKAEVQVDKPAAEAFKASHEALLAEVQKVIDSLTGKDNKKERTAKSKELSELKVDKQYIDACKVAKGLEPVSGFFTVASAGPEEPASKPAAAEAPAERLDPDAKKAARPAKKAESAGLSQAEKKELGMSGGQQNKDAQIVAWVARMNELKEKECPGSTQKPDKKEEKKKKTLGSDMQKAADALRQEIDEYKTKLKSEFGYSNKEIKADPDLADMEARLQAIEK
ncbi:unnamed protein product [Prorocentrum cordatum]|uniref:Eukaryotic translation initiation factor 3 30 kDa subunit n=1 Tax=Prorocentrum cordatum TaxID=2364126 RepID=A0ABN9SQJ1_9DINO|nr:unnamed protein product [Polarella glacialis]